MRFLLTFLTCAALVGCASPEYVASRSNWDVCRLSMGGPHAAFAEEEARRRGLDCRPYYGPIQQQLSNEAAATQQIQRMLNPQPALTCETTTLGSTSRTTCR